MSRNNISVSLRTLRQLRLHQTNGAVSLKGKGRALSTAAPASGNSAGRTIFSGIQPTGIPHVSGSRGLVIMSKLNAFFFYFF